MGFAVREPDAAEAQPEQELEEPDWYQLYCQAIASGVDPREFGDYTYSQIIAIVDGNKLSRFNDRYFDIVNIVSNMDDDGVRKSLYGNGSGNPLRGKLIEKMMRPYSPSFLLPEVAETRRAKPIEGLSPKAAEGIMQAIEAKIVPHDAWLAIHPLWQSIHATARLYRPALD